MLVRPFLCLPDLQTMLATAIITTLVSLELVLEIETVIKDQPGAGNQAAQSEHQLRQPVSRQGPDLRSRHLDLRRRSDQRRDPLRLGRDIQQHIAFRGRMHENIAPLTQAETNPPAAGLAAVDQLLDGAILMIYPRLHIVGGF